MNRPGQPAMRGVRQWRDALYEDEDDDDRYDDDRYADRRGGAKALRRGWALVRAIGLIVGVGVAVAGAIAIMVAALATLLESSV